MEILLNLKYDWAHNKIVYKSQAPATLYELTIVKAAIYLCYRQVDDLQHLNRYEYVADNFFEAISSLELPDFIKDDIACEDGRIK